MKKKLLLGFTIFILSHVSAQTTYTWKAGTASALFSTATNWNPSRTNPASTDILIFDLGNTNGSNLAGGIFVSTVPTQTIGELRIIHSGTAVARTVNFTVTSGSTLTVTGNLLIQQYCTLADGGNIISVGGNFVTQSNTGGNSTVNTTVHSGTGKIRFTGSNAQFINGSISTINTNGSNNFGFGNVEVFGSNATLSMTASYNTIQVNGSFTIDGGKFNIGTGTGNPNRQFTLAYFSTSQPGTIQCLNGGVIVGASNGGLTISGTGPTTGNQDIGTINFDATSATTSRLNNITFTRSNSTLTIGSVHSGGLNITGALSLNAGTLNDGGKVINVEAGANNVFTTLNTIPGNAVYTGTGRVNITRANATAPSFFTSSTSGATITVGNITWAPTASSTNPVFNSGTSPIKVIQTGAFNFVRNGSSNQTITLSNVDSFILSPTASITIPIGLTFDFNTKPVLFQSSATSTARIGTITGILSNATNVTVERYISLGKSANRFLTPSLTTNGSIRTNWQNGGILVNNLGTHITGSTTGTNGFDQTTTGDTSLFTYNNATGIWSGISNTNSNTLNTGTGYRLLIRGDRSVNLASPQDTMNNYTVLRTTGTVINGTGITPVDFIFPSINGFYSSYSLVGNPFISPIDWHTVSRSSLEDNYYAWEPNMGTSSQRGRYVSYSATTGFSSLGSTVTSNVGRYIQPGQAFFVKSNGGFSSLTIKESDKASTFVNSFNPPNALTNITVALFEPTEVNNGLAIDATTALLSNSFTLTIGQGDAKKIFSPGENISFKECDCPDLNEYLMVNARPINNNDTLRLQLTNMVTTTKNYAFKITESNFGAMESASLLDSYLNTSQLLNLNTSTVIYFSTTNGISASFAADRFRIVYKNQ